MYFIKLTAIGYIMIGYSSVMIYNLWLIKARVQLPHCNTSTGQFHAWMAIGVCHLVFYKGTVSLSV